MPTFVEGVLWNTFISSLLIVSQKRCALVCINNTPVHYSTYAGVSIGVLWSKNHIMLATKYSLFRIVLSQDSISSDGYAVNVLTTRSNFKISFVSLLSSNYCTSNANLDMTL